VFAPDDLDSTVTARWWRRLGGERSDRRHWRTRTGYYAAVSQLLEAGTHRPTWSDVVNAVRPRGNRSTLYDVTGVHAKHSLIGDLLAQETSDPLQIALYYRRVAAVDQLIDETKVWTYWPYRESLSTQYRIGSDLGEQASVGLLVDAVASWARRYPGLARALRHAPPVCTVEDLLLLQPGRCSAVHAMTTLTWAIEAAIDEHRQDTERAGQDPRQASQRSAVRPRD
jgi:hypothetical protein